MAANFTQLPFPTVTGSAATKVKALASAVSAGDLLCVIVWQYSATQVCTGVSDTVNGAWPAAVVGPIRSVSGLSNASAYIFVFPNSAAGTPTITATWDGAAGGGMGVIVVNGLGGGGAVDFSLGSFNTTPAQAATGATGTLAQAVEAGVVFVVAGSSSPFASPYSGFTNDAAPDSNWFERFARTITAATTSINMGWNFTAPSPGVLVVGATFKDAAAGDTTVPTLTGAITIGTVTPNSIDITHPAGADNVGVTSYEYSKDSGATWVDSGVTATAYSFTGLTASTSYGLRVRAKDAAGNVSTPALAATQSTSAAPVSGTLNFQAAGMEFGNRVGVGTDAGVNYRYKVFGNSDLMLDTPIITSSVIALDSAGKLPNLVSVSITPAATYRVLAIRQADGATTNAFQMVAT